MQDLQLIRGATLAGRGRCRRGRWLCLVFGTAVVLLLAFAQTASAVPDAPVLTGSDPASPANQNTPKVKGTVGPDTLTTVSVYTDATCSGSSVTGSVADFTSAGIPVTVPDDQVTVITATVMDAAGNTSACASPIAYTEDSTPPESAIESGPSGTIKTTNVTFTFASNEPTASFVCTLDGTSEPCTSSTSYSGLAAGFHTFSVRATDRAGNTDPTDATVSFTIDLSAPPPPPAPPAPTPVGTSELAARPAASFVLIAGRAVKVNRNRSVAVKLNCSGNKDCSGRVVLTTTSGIRFHRHRLVMRLGSARFAIPATANANVKVRLSKSKYRLLKRLRRARVLVTVTDVDRAGRARISTREITLRA
jgi:hypothetical protein